MLHLADSAVVVTIIGPAGSCELCFNYVLCHLPTELQLHASDVSDIEEEWIKHCKKSRY
jgi:hypothetical protein